MIETARARGVRFGYLGVDGGYGKEPAFLHGVDRSGCRFVADVHTLRPNRLLARPPTPATGLVETRQTPALRVDARAAARPVDAWQRPTLREAEKGKRVAEYLHSHVFVWDGAEAKAHDWHFFVRREVGAGKISHYGLSNAPADTPLAELARVQPPLRFFIEHSFREAKSECGLADDQVRRWDAWHHHMALVMPETLFPVKGAIESATEGRASC